MTEPPLSSPTVPKSTDSANGTTQPGISIRYGPAKDNEIDMQDADTNGAASSKRKSRSSAGRPSYVEAESSAEDDKPLVRQKNNYAPSPQPFFAIHRPGLIDFASLFPFLQHQPD